MQQSSKADPDSSSEIAALVSNSSNSSSSSNASKLVLQKRFLMSWLLMILLPLALVRVSLFYAFPQKLQGNAALSSGLGQMLEKLNLTIAASPAECDLLEGEWIYDETGPSYSNATCNHIQGHQNCLKNGRPDTAYMYWKWQPRKCDLPRFNVTLFMSLMRNKLLAFVGDSIARNHMQSLLCSLSQIESPVRTYTDGDDRHVRWWFPKNNFTLSTFWSPYLIFQTEEQPEKQEHPVIPEGTSQLHLDKLDTVWLKNMSEFDAMVISSGQWFFKTNLFFVNSTLIGCHHCDEAAFNVSGLGFYFPYRKVMSNVLQELASHPDYHGLTMVRSFSPDHFEDGRWDNGGNCKRTVPFPSNTSVPEGTLTYEMHKIQTEVFQEVAAQVAESLAAGKRRNRMRMVDVTRISYLRPDGHPGPYRNFQPFSKEFKGHVQNDCLHWCIPGPVDTWNDMILETLRRELS